MLFIIVSNPCTWKKERKERNACTQTTHENEEEKEEEGGERYDLLSACHVLIYLLLRHIGRHADMRIQRHGQVSIEAGKLMSLRSEISRQMNRQ